MIPLARQDVRRLSAFARRARGRTAAILLSKRRAISAGKVGAFTLCSSFHKEFSGHARARCVHCAWKGSGAGLNAGPHESVEAGRVLKPGSDDGAPRRDRGRGLVRRPGCRRAAQSQRQRASGSFRRTKSARVIRRPHHLDFRLKKAHFVSEGHHGPALATRTR